MNRKKILICDDDAGIMDLMEIILDEQGYHVIAEMDSLKVKLLIEKECPDLVVLDLWMPVLSGDMILQTIRGMPTFKNLPVVAVSASNDGRKIAMAAGATAFVAKPFDIDHLLEVIARPLDYC